MSLPKSQIHKYFSSRIPNLAQRDQVSARCPLHDDKQSSLSINLVEGVWTCHAGCGRGGMIDFEMLLSRSDHDTAKQLISNLLGVEVFGAENQPEAIYRYRDANGLVVFEKVRYPGKKFINRVYSGNGYRNSIGDVRRPLYNLPEVVTAAAVFVVEGEKDADNLWRSLGSLNADRRDRVATTTNFDGAGKWSDDYNPYFTGTKVFILPDNDALGHKHADHLAAAIYPYALGVKVVKLTGLSDKGDVSDYLKTRGAPDVLAEVNAAPQWRPPLSCQRLFLPAPEFVATVQNDIDWLIQGVIQRGANGFFVADPKGGKSWAAVDMAIALALGDPWLGFKVIRPTRVALISREDNPGLTAWRLKRLFGGRFSGRPWLLESNLYINTRAQSNELMLEDEVQLAELIKAMKAFKPEFAIFDVFNVMHGQDENDNKEMRVVLRKLAKIQAEVGCAIAVVHHFNKGDSTSITKRIRGSSAISGWAEWIIGISMADQATQKRKMEFELKAGAPPEPIYYRIENQGETTRLERDGAEYAPPPAQRSIHEAKEAGEIL